MGVMTPKSEFVHCTTSDQRVKDGPLEPCLLELAHDGQCRFPTVPREDAKNPPAIDPVPAGARLPDRIAVDADGFVWRIFVDEISGETWSMARINPDNSPTPEPVTFYEPRPEILLGDGFDTWFAETDPDDRTLQDAFEAGRRAASSSVPDAFLDQIEAEVSRWFNGDRGVDATLYRLAESVPELLRLAREGQALLAAVLKLANDWQGWPASQLPATDLGAELRALGADIESS